MTKFKITVLILLSILLFFTTSNLTAQKTPTRINEGLLKEREGKIDEAIENYKKYLKEHPEDVNITMRFMNLLFRERRYQEIISIYSNLNGELKKRREVVTILARAHFLLSQKKETVLTLRSIIRNEDNSKNSYLFVGNQFLSMGLIDDAKRTFLDGRKKWKKTSFSRELYLCYIKEDAHKKAIREILYYYSDNNTVKEWVKREIKKLVNKDASLISELEKIAGENKDYQKITGEIFLELGNVSKAKDYLLQALDSVSLLDFASVCIKEGYYQEAEESLNKVIKIATKEREKEEALFLLAITYEKMSRFDDAIKKLDRILETGKSLKDSAIVEKARILIFEKKEFEKGVRIIEPLLEKKGILNRNGILEIAIKGYIKSGSFDKAEDILKKTTSPLSIYLNGEILFLKTSFEESKEAFLKAVFKSLDKSFANNALERVMMIETLKEKPALLSLVSDIEKIIWEERYDEAIELINASFDTFKEKDERAALLFYKGKVYTFSGRLSDAVSSYTSIIGEDKDSPFSPKALYKAAILCKEEIKSLATDKN
ncbi:MAG: tetratricopeptide repeat protein [Candidatus Cloacimonadota bacterium]|nr:MAG: tetratricopeptide repeat protein [Candidatus Cloacimonadota bacterium]